MQIQYRLGFQLLQAHPFHTASPMQIRYRLGTNSVQIRLSMAFYGYEPNLLRVNIEFVEEKIQGKEKGVNAVGFLLCLSG